MAGALRSFEAACPTGIVSKLAQLRGVEAAGDRIEKGVEGGGGGNAGGGEGADGGAGKGSEVYALQVRRYRLRGVHIEAFAASRAERRVFSFRVRKSAMEFFWKQSSKSWRCLTRTHSRNGPIESRVPDGLLHMTFNQQRAHDTLAAKMTGKRPLEPSGLEDGDAKRIRSNDGSPAPPPPAANGESEVQRKKGELAERMAAIRARQAAARSNGGAPPASVGPPATTAAAPPAMNGDSDLERKKRETAEKIAKIKADAAAKRAQMVGSSASSVTGGVSTPPEKSQAQSEREARIAEARARAAKMAQNIAASSAASPAPPPPPPRQDGRGTARGGLGVGLHPSLMGDGPAKGKAGPGQTGPKFSTTKGNQQLEAPRINPYLTATEGDDDAKPRQDNEQDSSYDSNLAVRKTAGERKSKQLVFNDKGKFIAQANALRQQARLEEMKRRIAAETRKVEIEEASDKAFLVPTPPGVEWWDEGLLPEGNQSSYEGCLNQEQEAQDGPGSKISGPESIITALIQHPIQLQAPQDRLIPAPKPLMLTQTEQKKLRRQRRMADHKEEQAKIRLGLVEPPPPKVKKSNMMRVLGEQAVKDPTAVEARVNREIAQRAADHTHANEERKLTKEEKAEKLKVQQAGDEAKGVKICVFRVDDLSSGKHRYQVDVNAKQLALTGIVVLHPGMNLVVVEGGAHSISAYKKLMLNRVKWGENTVPLSNATPTTFTGSSNVTNQPSGSAEGRGSKAVEWCNPLTATGELKDLSQNRCVLVWEGDEQSRSFKRWGSKACETDGEARDVLSRQKMESLWGLAKNL